MICHCPRYRAIDNAFLNRTVTQATQGRIKCILILIPPCLVFYRNAKSHLLIVRRVVVVLSCEILASAIQLKTFILFAEKPRSIIIL